MFKELNKSTKDLIVIFLITTIISYILIKIDAFELFSEYSENHEEYELDEIILILLVLAFSFLGYSYRRFKEIQELKLIIEKNNINLSVDNIKKDKLLLEQVKMASLGEMIENIAHQWRQPLSMISTAASGIKIKKEFNQLKENEVEETLDNILINTQYLSSTIENFRNFIYDVKTVSLYNPNEVIYDSLNILKGNLKIANIELILNLDADIKIEGYPNDLIQVIINIINNSKDAFEVQSIKEKYIFLSTKIINNNLQIKIKDTAEGIEESIHGKIFEPYFTTKHNSIGTGLGLYMSYKIINEKLNGFIDSENSIFIYQTKEYKGAEFILEIPLPKSAKY